MLRWHSWHHCIIESLRYSELILIIISRALPCCLASGICTWAAVCWRGEEGNPEELISENWHVTSILILMLNLFMHAEISTVASQQAGSRGFSVWGLSHPPASRRVLLRHFPTVWKHAFTVVPLLSPKYSKWIKNNYKKTCNVCLM